MASLEAFVRFISAGLRTLHCKAYTVGVFGGKMEAKLEQYGDIFVCRLSGRMNYQSVDPFQEICIKNLANRKVIFNLRDLNFVGSIGIGQFMDTMSQLSESPDGQLKFCGVQTEFRRIFEVNDVIKEVEIFEDEQRAHLSFQGYTVAPINAVFLNSLIEVDFVEDAAVVVNSEVPQDNMTAAPVSGADRAGSESNVVKPTITQPETTSAFDEGVGYVESATTGVNPVDEVN